MSFKKRLADLLAEMPDDEAVEATENEPGEAENAPDTSAESEPREATLEPSTEEEVEVTAAPEDTRDITVVTSDDMLEQSIDMRLASFYQAQQELENTVKVLLGEVATLKSHFKVIETAIDTAAETSPTVESIENLINQL